MRITIILLLAFLKLFANGQTTENEINNLLDNWHKAAANADTLVFFNSMDDNAIYIGTDATERWTKQEFYNYSIPYFRKGKAWDFKPIERKIYFSDDKNIAWFNETLDTWTGICRSSGVLVKASETWKIKHYHLSVAVPNELIKEVIEVIHKTK